MPAKIPFTQSDVARYLRDAVTQVEYQRQKLVDAGHRDPNPLLNACDVERLTLLNVYNDLFGDISSSKNAKSDPQTD